MVLAPVPPLATGIVATVLRLPLASLVTMPAVVRPVNFKLVKVGLATTAKVLAVMPPPAVPETVPVKLPEPVKLIDVLPCAAVPAVEP